MLDDYVLYLMKELRLPPWKITLEVVKRPGDESGSNVDGWIDPTEGRYRAVMEISDEVREQGGDRLRHTLVHELLHLHHRGVDSVVLKGPVSLSSQQGYDVLIAWYKTESEQLIDALTEVIAPRLKTWEEYTATVA